MSKEINGTSKAAVALSIKSTEGFGPEEFVAFLQEKTALGSTHQRQVDL